MNFSTALAVILSLLPCAHGNQPAVADKFHATKDYIGNTMWIFGSDGIYAYSPDGESLKVRIDAKGICGPKEDYTGPSYAYCRFQDTVSDGKKYIWAAVNRGKPMIDLFDIDTGAVVGSFDTCNGPEKIEYHALRDEIWVRCSEIVEDVGETTNLDVISASNPSGDIQTDILLQERALEEGISSDGFTVIEDSLGDVGYLTDNKLNHLFKLDLSQKNIVSKIEEFPLAAGLDVAVYSPVNKHIYIRSQVCCTCGFDGAQVEKCNRDGSPGEQVSITTGPFAGQIQQGTCGRSCSGRADADSIGIYEFDTASEKVVANFVMAEGFGGDPYVSPDGKFVVLLAKNGGKTIRILKAGEQGLASRVYIDLELDFDNSGYEGKSVARFVSFVTRDGKNWLIMPSGTSHKIAIVDLSNEGYVTNDTINIEYVTLSTEEFSYGAPHGMYRRIMWAEGTDYVWVSNSNEDKVFIVDIAQKRVVKTLTGFKTSSFLSVQNYERARQIEMQKQMVHEMMEGMQGNQQQTESVNGSMESTVPSEKKSGSQGIEIAAIAIGCIALVAGVVNLAYMAKMRKDFLASIKHDEPAKFIEAKRDIEDVSDTGLVSMN